MGARVGEGLDVEIGREIQRAFFRAALFLLGVAMVFIGTLLLALGSLEGEGSGGGFVIIGPFIFAYGREVPSWLAAVLVAAALGATALFLYVVKRTLRAYEAAVVP
ncbi:MAG: hypothetical protein DRO01_00570 [Thermoproteota archaeon]|nr:MAG: hypothetical protein DRO01_00570 [Candidatus Korarchaeota archaeon]